MSVTRFVSKQLTAVLFSLCIAPAVCVSQSRSFQINPSAGPTGVTVKGRLGGEIFGFDVDQSGSEGLLSEARSMANGSLVAAIETFDQKTGKIIKVVQQTQGQDDFLTVGVVGTSVGLVEREHEISFLNFQRTFSVMNPLSGNAITGKWTPPIGKDHLLSEVSHTQGGTTAAFFAMDNSGNFISWVFSSNIAANTFGRVVHITDSDNFGSVVPPMAYNPQTNQAVLGGGNGCFGCFPIFGVADLKKGTFTEFNGAGFGFVDGIAIDPADNLVMTTTEDDASVEIYDINTFATLAVIALPNSGENQFFSGGDVQYDPINRLFLVAQPNSSSTASGSTIYVFDTPGNLQGTLDGFNFVVGAHIAINPSSRIGYVDGTRTNLGQIQQFVY